MSSPTQFFRILLLATIVLIHSGCALLFPTEAGESLAHFESMAPAPGEPAPELDVRLLNGESVALHDLIGQRPVVLQLGSHSCPVYRYRRFDLFKLQRAFKDQVDFVVVYTTEAHPVGAASPYRDEEWLSFPNWITNTRVSQTSNLSERLERAAWSTHELDRQDLILVDTMNDATWKRYGAAPSAAFVIDANGVIVLAQPWVEPEGIRQALQNLLE